MIRILPITTANHGWPCTVFSGQLPQNRGRGKGPSGPVCASRSLCATAPRPTQSPPAGGVCTTCARPVGDWCCPRKRSVSGKVGKLVTAHRQQKPTVANSTYTRYIQLTLELVVHNRQEDNVRRAGHVEAVSPSQPSGRSPCPVVQYSGDRTTVLLQ